MFTDNLIGRQIDDFRIDERLGQGAMATVYKAYQPSINRYVALKVIQVGMGQQEEFRKRFDQEAEVIARLEHIHILPIYAYGIKDDLAYLAMRWLRGGSLSELIRRGQLPIERIADIFKQIAQGLSYAHSKGIIHRDLKPSNIMLDDAGNAYLTDFGLAKFIEATGDLTRSGTVVGTPAYMSPEQLRGEPLDARSDIYSLGVILYNMAVGRLPFEVTSGDLVSVIYQHLEKQPPRPRELNPNISPEVEAVILRTLSKKPADRFQSAMDVSRALDSALGRSGSTDSFTSLPSSPDLISRTTLLLVARRNRWKLIAGLTAVITLIALMSVLILRGSQQTFKAPIILAGESGNFDISIPSADEIEVARQRLGNNGFIAYVACTLDTAFHAGLGRTIRDLATRDGLAVQVYDSEADNYKQLAQIERARSEGASAIILCPLDSESIVDSLESMQRSALPVVLHSNDLTGYNAVLIAGDNYLLGLEPGRFAGRIVAEEMNGQANVIILDYPDLPDIVRRADGLEDGLLEFAPEAIIIGRFRGATPDFAKESVTRLIEDGVEFNVILSINDAGSFGAIEAMESAGFAPDSVIISSVDAETLAQQYIRDGRFIRGSVRISPEITGTALLNTAVRLLAGATIPEMVLVPAGEMVTKDTLTASGQ